MTLHGHQDKVPTHEHGVENLLVLISLHFTPRLQAPLAPHLRFPKNPVHVYVCTLCVTAGVCPSSKNYFFLLPCIFVVWQTTFYPSRLSIDIISFGNPSQLGLGPS